MGHHVVHAPKLTAVQLPYVHIRCSRTNIKRKTNLLWLVANFVTNRLASLGFSSSSSLIWFHCLPLSMFLMFYLDQPGKKSLQRFFIVVFYFYFVSLKKRKKEKKTSQDSQPKPERNGSSKPPNMIKLLKCYGKVKNLNSAE